MSLTRKVVIIVILVFLVSSLASFGIQQIFIMPSFITLEKETATRNTGRALGAIDRELDQIAISATDWATWTETYDYVKGQNDKYVQENLDVLVTVQELNMNFMGVYDTAGKAVWSQSLDLETTDTIDLGILNETVLPVDHPLLQHRGLESEVKGIVATPSGPLLVVAEPILTTDAKGPVAGTFVFGRLLDDVAIEHIAELTKLPVTAKKANQQLTPSRWIGAASAMNGLRYSDFKLVDTPEIWQVHTTIADIFGHPILMLQVDTSRDISAQGARAINQAQWVLAATGLLMMLVLWKLLQRAILHPISELKKHALRIGENDASQIQLNLKRNDEVGVLARTLDQMFARLTETQNRLIEQSYHSGIAEMASGVLHNIGNSITPLKIRLSTLQQGLKTAPLVEMELAAAELADPSTTPERNADLVQFVELAGGEIAGLIKNSLREIEASIQQVNQVQEILTDQQRFSRSARVIESVDMVSVINKVESSLHPELKEALHVEITPSVAEKGVVAGSRVALQQVVANILINAAESIQSAATGAGSVTVTAENEDLLGKSMVGLRFADNGAGIDREHLGRLFERGFSTKNRLGSGHGLHWSANTVLALGGRISAENNTTGSGSCIHLLLPPAEIPVQKNTNAAKDQNELRN